MKKKGLLIVNTGNGKGKSTAAFGVILRACGYNFKTCVIQFIKGNWKTGEIAALKKFDDLVDVYISGKGFTWESRDINEDIEAARNAWEMAKEIIQSRKFDLVVLDELTYLIKYNFVEEDDIIETLKNKPEELHVVVTGRNASEKLIEIADLVSEIRAVKHPYEKGIKAQRGIEF